MHCTDCGFDNPLAREAFAQSGVPCVCAPLTGSEPEYWIVYFHGNSENMKLAYPYAKDLGKKFRAHVFVVEYEGYCSYKGGAPAPSERGCFGNADRFVAHIKRVAPVPVLFVGYSMGCAVALHAAHTHRRTGVGGGDERFPHAVLLMAPFLSAASVKLARNHTALAFNSLWAPFDVMTMKHAALEQGHPLVAASGDADDVVPREHAELIVQLAKRHAPAEYVRTGDTHASVRADPEGRIYPAFGAFLQKLRS